MSEEIKKNVSIHISDRSHLNLTFNIYHCGNNDVFSGDRFPMLKNDMFTFFYINSGTGFLESSRMAIKLTASQGFVAFPNGQYHLTNTGDEHLNVTWVAFSGYLVENYLNRANISMTKPLITDIEGCIGNKINRLYMISHKLPNRYCKMVSILYDIFAYLLDTNPTKPLEDFNNNADFFAIKAIDYIERNYMQNISVDEIAAILGITRKHFYTIFNNILNISPKKYIIYFRVEKACKRLRDSTQMISEIAESVGYTNQFYFAKEFKRLTGMTPTKYRNAPHELEIFHYATSVPTLKKKFEDQLNAYETDIYQNTNYINKFEKR